MEVLGLVFAGSATGRRPEMAAFVGDVLGLEPAPAGGVSADMFGLPDGSLFAVADPREMGETSRTIGFRQTFDPCACCGRQRERDYRALTQDELRRELRFDR